MQRSRRPVVAGHVLPNLIVLSLIEKVTNRRTASVRAERLPGRLQPAVDGNNIYLTGILSYGYIPITR